MTFDCSRWDTFGDEKKPPLTSNYIQGRHDADGNQIVEVTAWRKAIDNDRRLTKIQDHAAMKLSMFVRDGAAFPSIELLTEKMHYSRHSRKEVARALAGLRRLGYLRSIKISRKPEPGFRYIHYLTLPGDWLKHRAKRADPYVLSEEDRPF